MSYNGILIVDKPVGWTSHDVVAKLRGALKTKRIGHGGTLDPMATGVLPVFVGSATKAAEICENAEKEYIAGLRLGVTTDTQDITGRILSEAVVSVSAEDLTAVLLNFQGAQKQTPPMYSAIKQNGKKLYELARSGVEVPRPARDIFISVIELLDGGGNEFRELPDGGGNEFRELPDGGGNKFRELPDGGGNEFLFRAVCSKGTYIRTLCNDIGARLGCGGTMSSLCRTRAGSFTIGMSQTLDAILSAVSSGGADDVLLPTDSVFSKYPPVALSADETRKVRNGAASLHKDLPDGNHRFYGPDNEFLLLGDVTNKEIKVIKRFFGP